MPADPPVLLVVDIRGPFAFALNGALTPVRAAHVDIVGVLTLGMITALGEVSASIPPGSGRSMYSIPDVILHGQRAWWLPVRWWIARGEGLPSPFVDDVDECV
jgi:Glycine transporter